MIITKIIKDYAEKSKKPVRYVANIWKDAELEADRRIMMNPPKHSHLSTLDGTKGEFIASIARDLLDID